MSSENLQGIAPGQFGVVYDEAAQVCVGSGEIDVYKRQVKRSSIEV